MVENVSEEKKKPTLKELFQGTTLDGYIEAAKTKPISSWFPQQVEGVEKVTWKSTAPEALEKIDKAKIQAILNFIVEAQLMYGWVGKEDIYAKFEKLGYSREEVEKVLSQLLREGTIYEPREGFVRKT